MEELPAAQADENPAVNESTDAPTGAADSAANQPADAPVLVESQPASPPSPAAGDPVPAATTDKTVFASDPSQPVKKVETPNAVETPPPAAPSATPTEPPASVDRGSAPESAPRNFVGELLNKAQDKLRQRKEKKLQKILVLARDRGRIENHDVRKLLRCSDATATRYLQELEKQGRIIQDSRRGGASYRFLG